MFIINDETPDHLWQVPADQTTGLDLSSRPNPGGFGYGATASPFPDELLIPRSEWRDRIQEMEDTKSRISDWIRLKKLPVKNQGRTNFCWANAPVTCLEIIRIMSGQRMVELSPASVACQINGFRNQGGWGKDALDWLIDHGAYPADKWPANAIDSKYLTSTPDRYTVEEWFELIPRNVDQLMSMLLRRVPVAIGLNWWGHEVTAIDPVWKDGQPAIRILNSWGDTWGANGQAILQGSKMLPDDAVCPRVAG